MVQPAGGGVIDAVPSPGRSGRLWNILSDWVGPASSLAFTVLYFLAEWRNKAQAVDLPWPGRQVIPSILDIRGILTVDPVSIEARSSPYSVTAHFLDWAMPADWDQFLAAYETWSLALTIAVTWLSAMVLTRFTVWSASRRNLWPSSGMKVATVFLYLFYTVVPLLFKIDTGPTIVTQTIKFLTAPPTAGWSFPLSDSLNPAGLAFLLTLILLAVILSTTSKRRSWWSIVIYAIMFSVLTLIHPVVTLFGVGLLSVAFLVLPSGKRRSDPLLPVLLASFAGALLGAVATLLIFAQAPIDSSRFFEIYVVERHPHHYLPSSYLPPNAVGLMVSVAVLVVPILLSWKFKALVVPRQLALVAIAGLVVVHLTQYVAVELAHVTLFITLGITRLSSLFNFLYLATVGLVLVQVVARPIVRLLPRLGGRFRIIWRGVAVGVSVSTAAVLTFGGVWLQERNDAVLESIPRSEEAVVRDAFRDQFGGDAFMVLAQPAQDLRYREISGFGVYSDAYFPFTTAGIIPWDERKANAVKIFACMGVAESDPACVALASTVPTMYVITDDAPRSRVPSLCVPLSTRTLCVYKFGDLPVL